MMTETGELTRAAHAELLGVVVRYEDRAMDFVWKHKGALAVSAVLSEFLADPAPFLDGSRDLAGAAASTAAGAVAGVPGRVADEVGRRSDWALTALPWVALVAAVPATIGCRMWRRNPEVSGRRAYRL